MTNDKLERVEALLHDTDHILATGAQREWLIEQLAAWPTRVDRALTTNIEFLMKSAARTLAAACEAEAGDRERAWNDRLCETQMLAHKWMVAHDRLQAGKPYDFPKPADLPDTVKVLREALIDWRNCWHCPATDFEAQVERLLAVTDAALKTTAGEGSGNDD